MNKRIFNLIAAALCMGAAFFPASPVWAGSCCGGGAGVTLVLPKDAKAAIDASFDLEKYDGFWTKDGKYLRDEDNTDLRQYRLNLGYALRLAPRWQASVAAPYIWNRNSYSGISSNSSGEGDTTVTLWYEAFDTVMCRWGGDLGLDDLVPSATLGMSLTIPTGISPYDDVESSFDITGRGFYRLDANALLEKTLFPWSASLSLSYGKHFERPVNREYGEYVQPYRKKLGDRASGAYVLSYVQYVDVMESRRIMTYSASFSEIWEEEGTINGDRDPTTGMRKSAVAGTLMYSTLDRRWNTRLTWNHSIKQDGWGNNFPASDIFSLGVAYVFK